MKLFQRITLALMGCMLLSTPAMAADYSFETKAPADYYGSTAYEEVYGAQYNYGGQNAVDFLDPLADSAPSPLAGNTIEYGIGSSSGSIYPDGTSNDYPLQWGGPSVTPVTAFTPVSDVEQANGSIGTLSIPSLGIRYRVYDGTSSASMRKGVGHFPSTSAWSGNIGLCGHNRGSSHNIGSIKNLEVGDAIRYETSLGTRTYSVSYVGIIDWTDWSYDKPANLKVTVTKTGNKQLLAGDSMRYDLTVANNSNVALENFYLHDQFPTDCSTAKTITTGTYNTRLNYQITYKTNYNDYRVLATNLLSTNNYAFDLSAVQLMQGEVVTDVRLEFGKVPAGFASVVKPTVTVQTSASLANGYQVVNRVDAGGQYMSQWETGRAAWITLIVRLNEPTLPKTGY